MQPEQLNQKKVLTSGEEGCAENLFKEKGSQRHRRTIFREPNEHRRFSFRRE